MNAPHLCVCHVSEEAGWRCRCFRGPGRRLDGACRVAAKAHKIKRVALLNPPRVARSRRLQAEVAYGALTYAEGGGPNHTPDDAYEAEDVNIKANARTSGSGRIYDDPSATRPSAMYSALAYGDDGHGRWSVPQTPFSPAFNEPQESYALVSGAAALNAARGMPQVVGQTCGGVARGHADVPDCPPPSSRTAPQHDHALVGRVYMDCRWLCLTLSFFFCFCAGENLRRAEDVVRRLNRQLVRAAPATHHKVRLGGGEALTGAPWALQPCHAHSHSQSNAHSQVWPAGPP